jgi:tetratricopeptide (TPR) repeat protein
VSRDVTRAMNTLLLCWMIAPAAGWTDSPPSATEREEPAALRLTVTHFQDRTQGDEYVWLQEALADQLRPLLAAARMEVVDYQHLSAVGQEQTIGDTGLPAAQAEAAARVAAPEIAVTGEYSIADGRIEIAITASRIDPPELLTKVTGKSAIKEAGRLLKDLVPDLLRGLERPPSAESLKQIATLELPSYEFQRWYHEGRVYLSVGMYPEAWYCFTQAIHQNPADFYARHQRARTLREMGMYEHALAELVKLNDRIERGDNAGLILEDPGDRIWFAPGWEESFATRPPHLDLLLELWRTLSTNVHDSFGTNSPLATPIRSSLWAAYGDLIGCLSDTIEIRRANAAEDMESAWAAVRKDATEVQACELLARYWHAKGDAAQANAYLARAENAWNGIRKRLVTDDADPSPITTVEQAFEETKALIGHVSSSESRSTLEYHPPPQPKRPPWVDLDPLPCGQAWSDAARYGWAQEFTPTQLLWSHDGQHLAVGVSRFLAEDRKSETVLMGYIRSDDGQTWAEPVLFPSPINSRHCHNNYPILLPLSDGSYLLGWLSDREGREERVFVSRTRDLVHWSHPIRTPGIGRFDLAELPDGSVLIASRNTLITRSYDLVSWSLPRLAIAGLGLKMPDLYSRLQWGSEYGVRWPRLIVGDQGRIHLLAIVQPGVDQATSLEVFVHAVSDDGVVWTRSLTLLAEKALTISPYDRSISAAAVPGGGVVALLQAKRPVPEWKDRREGWFYDLVYTADGRTWTRCASLLNSWYRNSLHAPVWGALSRDPSDTLRFTLLLNQAYGYRRYYRQAVLSPERLRASGDVLDQVDASVFGTAWNEAQEGRALCVVFDTHPGRSKADHIANSMGLLVQRDLQFLDGIQPVMAAEIQTGIDVNDTDFEAALQRPGIRWADYLVQFAVSGKSTALSVRCRVVDVEAARTVYERTIKCNESDLPETQKAFSRAIADCLNAQPTSDTAAELFAQQLVGNPSAYVYLSEMGVPRSDPVLKPERLFEWLDADPESPLPYAYSSVLSKSGADEPGQATSERARQFRRHETEQRNRAQWRNPLNPFDPDYFGTVYISDSTGDHYKGIRCERDLRSIPDCLPLRVATIQGWLSDGIFDRARPHIEYVEQHYRDDAAAVAECARAREFIEDFGRAKELWEYFLSRWSEDDRSWPYWYCETRLDQYDFKPIMIPARIRLAMAEIRLGEFADSIDVIREWYESDATPIQYSPVKTLALAFYTYAVLESGQPESAIDVALCGLRVPDDPEGRIYRHPATVHYIHALMRVGRRMSARVPLSAILNQGYWYETYHRAFLCPPKAVLQEELLRMQLHRPLMGG